MGFASRTFLIAQHDRLGRLASAAFDRMLRDPASNRLPQFAGQRVRMASIIVELDRGLPEPLVFCNEVGGELHKNSLDEACDRVLRRAGIRCAGGHLRLRHSYALEKLAATGNDYALVARYLGVVDVENWSARHKTEIDRYMGLG